MNNEDLLKKVMTDTQITARFNAPKSDKNAPKKTLFMDILGERFISEDRVKDRERAAVREFAERVKAHVSPRSGDDMGNYPPFVMGQIDRLAEEWGKRALEGSGSNTL